MFAGAGRKLADAVFSIFIGCQRCYPSDVEDPGVVSYIGLGQSRVEPAKHWTPYDGLPGINHLAYEIDDVAALRAQMISAGYTESTPPNSHPYRKRLYFYDPEGNDWEFVQYLSQDPAERNDYKLPDR